MRVRTVAGILAAALICAAPALADLEFFLQPDLGFTGTTLGEAGYIPPDTMGAVGRDHIVELINGRYKVYNKTDGSVAASSSLNSFWTGAGVSWNSGTFDPRVAYDPFSERYYASALDNGGSANSYLFAVSNSDNPTDGWTGTAIDSDSDDSHWADFETLGFGADGVYMGANMFGLSGQETRASIVALEKAPLLQSTPTFSYRIAEDLPLGGTGFAPQPIINYDNTGTPHDYIGVYSGDRLQVSTISGDISNPSLTVGADSITTVTVSDPPDADQPTSAADLETNDIRISSNVIQVNGSYWGTQSVDRNGRAAVRWFEVDPSDYTVIQEGFITDPDLDLSFPSIAVSEDGFAAIGFSGSGDSQYASAYVVHGEMQGGTMLWDDPLQLQAGNGPYEVIDSSGRNRWGDYSATVIDPYNPNVFWTFQEYVYADNNWGTYIQRLDTERVPEPGTVALISLGLAGLGWLRRRRD